MRQQRFVAVWLLIFGIVGVYSEVLSAPNHENSEVSKGQINVEDPEFHQLVRVLSRQRRADYTNRRPARPVSLGQQRPTVIQTPQQHPVQPQQQQQQRPQQQQQQQRPLQQPWQQQQQQGLPQQTWLQRQLPGADRRQGQNRQGNPY